MLNSVGLQGPGVAAWLARRPARARAARAPGWSRASGAARSTTTRRAAKLLVDAPTCVVAVEVNLSCPNLDGGAHLFAHSPEATRRGAARRGDLRPAALGEAQPEHRPARRSRAPRRRAGADAVTLVNTVLGMAIDVETGRPALGAGRAEGCPVRAIHPVAVRAVHDVRAAVPDLPIVGVGGVATGADAVELMMAGASAVQVGTATFADPQAPRSVLHGLRDWCERHEIGAVTEIVGAAVHEDR